MRNWPQNQVAQKRLLAGRQNLNLGQNHTFACIDEEKHVSFQAQEWTMCKHGSSGTAREKGGLPEKTKRKKRLARGKRHSDTVCCEEEKIRLV